MVLIVLWEDQCGLFPLLGWLAEVCLPCLLHRVLAVPSRDCLLLARVSVFVTPVVRVGCPEGRTQERQADVKEFNGKPNRFFAVC